MRENLDTMKEDHPGLKKSQYQERLFKEFNKIYKAKYPELYEPKMK
jgi:tRNA nucleotidyltransferase/poly(A) polymerase